MGLIRQMAMGAGVSAAAAGVSLVRRIKDAPQPLAVLERAVNRAVLDDDVDDDSKAKLISMLERKDRKGLTAELSRLHHENQINFAHARVQYSEGDVANMRGETEAAFGNLALHVDRLDALIPSTFEPRGVEKDAAFLHGVLEKFDAKYKNVDPERIKARVQEATLESFFMHISKVTDKDLEVVGLNGDQIGKAQALRTQLKAEARAAKAAEKEKPAKDQTPPFTIHRNGESRSYRAGLKKLDDGSYRLQLRSIEDNPITGSSRSPGKMTGHEVMAKLGIDPASITPPMMTAIAERTAEKHQSLARLWKDFLKVFKRQGRPLAKAAVDTARLQQIPPARYIETVHELKKISAELGILAMAGRETTAKLVQTKEVHAYLAMVIDEMLADREVHETVQKLLEDPDTMEVVNAMLDSKDIEKIMSEFQETLGRVSTLRR